MNHLGSLVIETEHLYLRPFVLEDAPAMFEKVGHRIANPEICRRMPMHLLERTEESISGIEQYHKPDTYKWALCLASLDQVIGDISVVSQDQEVNHAS